jgi:hypothetical protein
MKDADMPLLDRVEAALERVRNRQGLMRIPVEATDMDVVVSDCREEIKRLRAEVAALKQNSHKRDNMTDIAGYAAPFEEIKSPTKVGWSAWIRESRPVE